MEKLRADLDKVKQILSGAPRGMTISDVAKQMGVNRNAVAKYLEILRMSGEIELKSFGRAKIFSIASHLPLMSLRSLSSDLIVLIDSEINVVDVNDPFLRYTGMNRDRIAGLPIDQTGVDLLLHPFVLLNLKDALNEKEYIGEIQVARGKEMHYFRVKLIPVETSDLRSRVAIVYENITAHKKAGVALKESEALYRAVVEDQTEIICRMMPDTTLTFVNGAWCTYFKCTPEAMLGKKCVDMLSPGYRRSYLSYLSRIKADQPTTTAEIEIPMKGGVRWFQSTYHGRFDDHGRLTEVQIVSRDITARRQAEKLSHMLSLAVERVPSAVIITSREGAIEYVNPKFTALSGYTLDDVLGKSPRLLKSGHTAHEEYVQLWGTILTGGEWKGEFMNRKKNGELYHVTAVIYSITDDFGRIKNFVAVEKSVAEPAGNATGQIDD